MESFEPYGGETSEESKTGIRPGGVPLAPPKEIAHEYGRDHDRCLGCVACLPLLKCRHVPKAIAFTLAGSSLTGDGTLIADAHGLLLPDGRTVTYCPEPYDDRDPVLRVWPDVRRPAEFWGSWVLWR